MVSREIDNRVIIRYLSVILVILLFILTITISIFPRFNDTEVVDVPIQQKMTGMTTGIVTFSIVRVASGSTSYRNRIFYEPGSKINLTVILNGRLSDTSELTADFSCLDSEFNPGEETVTYLGDNPMGQNYSVSYTLSNFATNTRTNVNNAEDPINCPPGAECHRTCNVTLSVKSTNNETVQVAFYRGIAANNNAWYVDYVTRASNCALGLSGSNYFLEDNTCTKVYYNPNTLSYYIGASDIDFAIVKKNAPDTVETDCTDGSDNDGDNKIDCADSDCASIVYGEYYIVGESSNSFKNSSGHPNWVCSKTTAGWRDDPPYLPLELDTTSCVGGIACDNSCASNLCRGTLAGTTLTFPYRIAPGASFKIKLEDSTVSGVKVYYTVSNFNSSVWSGNYADFETINQTPSKGLTGKNTSIYAIITQSGPNPPTGPTAFGGSAIDLVLKANILTGYEGLFGLVLNRIFDGSSSTFKFNINFTNTGMSVEHNISCADTHDNDLDYTTDCNDTDCDAYKGFNTLNPDGTTYPLCAFGNESKYASTNNSCMDNFDNDNDTKKDCHWSSGTWDLDCNNTNIINASWDVITNVGAATGICQLGKELTCNDGFDNDRDRAFDCNTTTFFTAASIDYSSNPTNPTMNYSGTLPSIPHGEYNCYNDANCPSAENGTTCLDGMDNDLDFFSGLTGAGADCRMIEYDVDCNTTTVNNGSGSFTCELINEITCNDGYDNDRDGVQDCLVYSTGGSTVNPTYLFQTIMTGRGEYDCRTTCNISANYENDATKCADNKDNDLDYYTITGWTGTQYTATKNNASGGMDCRYNNDGDHYPDADCNGTAMGPGDCELGHEITCNDDYDNDQDNPYNKGGNRSLNSGGADCDDYDCRGDANCPSTESGATCVDGIDNDLDRYNYNITDYLLDTSRIVNTTGGIDCIYYANGYYPNVNWPYTIPYDSAPYRYTFDPDCNNSAIGPSGQKCELIDEKNCTDEYDNDQDYYVNEIQRANWSATPYNAYFSSTYTIDSDCDDYSCSGNGACPSNEANSQCTASDCPSIKNWCMDSIDNDLDNYLINGFTSNSATGAGIDCVWANYDSDCNNTYINDSGYVGLCQLRWEYNCTDNVDNDQDLGSNEVNAGKNTGVDCDDYNCYGIKDGSNKYICTDDPSGASISETICNDTLDNDLDAYTWNGTAYAENNASGTDCADPDCSGRTGPGGTICALSEQMIFSPTFDDTICGDYTGSGISAFAVDNDASGYANCHDSGCYAQGICRVCPPTENITIDSCMDGLNNELQYQDAVITTMNYGALSGGRDTYTDCADTDCNGLVGKLVGVQGICNGGSLTTETGSCTDGYDNDFGNNIDCEDSDCSSDASCQALYTNTVTACTSGTNCTLASAVSYPGQPPKSYVGTNWGSGTVDLTYIQYEKVGKNLTFRFQDDAVNVNGKTVLLFIGSASATYIPLEYKLTPSNSGIYGTNSENFTVSYSAQSGSYYQAVKIQYDGAYPNQALDLTFWIQLPDEVGIVDNSSYTFYVSSSIAGTEKSADVTQYILESEAPQAPVFIKTSPANDLYTTSRLKLIKTDNTVTRLTNTDTITVKVNASDLGTKWNSGIELCQFYFSGSWINDADCNAEATLSDGSNTIYARAIDGVGNIGPNTSLTINVKTLPKQTSAMTMSRDYYLPSDLTNVSVTFTSPNNFIASEQGCEVFAETNTPGSRVSLGKINLTPAGQTGQCNGAINFSTLTEGYYTIKVQANDSINNTIISGEDPWRNSNTKENIWICDYMQTASGYTCKDTCESQAGEKPSKVVLISPENGNTTNTRDPIFIWSNATVNSSTTPLYEIQIDDSILFATPEYTQNGIAEGADNRTNHTLTSYLDPDKTYYWRVRAYYNLTSGDWSEIGNFTLESLISINLTVSTIDFGAPYLNDSNDTIDNDPPPLLLENQGNIDVNISINASALWATVAYPNSSYYSFAIGENESSSFNIGSSLTAWTEMSQNSTHAITDLNWINISNTAEIDLNITVPDAETPGIKESSIELRTT